MNCPYFLETNDFRSAEVKKLADLTIISRNISDGR